MNEILRKIYDNIICYEKETVEAGWRIDCEIKKLAHPYREKLGEDQMDGLESLLSQISLISQREGFEIGVRFAVKVLSELLP